jgi:membrane protein YdbS with pleckstrin-like domain
LKRLAITQLLFAFAPIILVAALPIEDSYNQTVVAATLSFNVVWTLTYTIVQIIILAVVFFWWYLPSYFITKQEIYWQRDGFVSTQPLANTYAITNIDIHQSILGKRFNYGTLIIHTSDQNEPANLNDIDGPEQNARLLEGMVDKEYAPQALPSAKPVQELILDGENQSVEFKASLQWDYRQQKRNKDLYEPVMKNLAAFMNTLGGTILIGVDDDGVVLGLEPDYNTMGKKNSDGFENVFNMAFNKMVGPEYRQYISVTFPEIELKEICVIYASPSADPVFLTHKGEEKFYIRTGNTSQPLSVSKATRYIQTRYQE